MTNKVRVKNPNALVFIYNYKDRLGDSTVSADPFEIDQIILNSTSLKSVSTQKNKSNPAGAFEFRLAPTKNWVTAISPGSWCVILMSNNKLDDKAKYGGGLVDESSFKMLGRIESVRGVTNTNQTTGARETEYIVTGADWGTIFNSRFYVDVLNRAPNESAVGMAERFGYTEYLLKNVGYDSATLGGTNSVPAILSKPTNDNSKSSVDRAIDFIVNSSQGAVTPPLAPVETSEGESQNSPEVKLPTARDNVDFILSLWGRSDNATSEVKRDSGLVAKSEQVFKIPNKLARYMGFVDEASNDSPIISQMLQQKSGQLSSLDTYTDKDMSAGIVNFQSILGEHSIWQILNDNCNEVMNELIPEIRFEEGIPKLTLYNRVRPFTINEEAVITRDDKAVNDLANEGTKRVETVKDFISRYKNVKRLEIDVDDVILCSYGTNWRDRVNFIEVNIARSLFQENYAADIKLESQFVDQNSIGRDGLLSMMKSTTYVPIKDEVANPIGVSAYKYLLKEWHFNTHKMFNGTLNLIGQDQYIQVGDNILVEAQVLNQSFNSNNQQKITTTNQKTYLMAHVESVSHNTAVDGNGGRVFTTSINFVRGIITDVNGNVIVSDDIVGAVDQDAELTTPTTEKNKNSFGTSGPLDPDRQKLKGT